MSIKRIKIIKRDKFVILVLLLILVLIGGGCSKSPKSFYKKICKVAVPLQEKVDDFYGSSGTDFGYYDNVDECVGESLEKEQELYEECLFLECLEGENECDNVKKDKGYKGLEKLVNPENCQGTIDEIREFTAKIYTKDGCEERYGAECEAYKLTTEAREYLSSEDISEMENQYDDCTKEVEELCENLPENF